MATRPRGAHTGAARIASMGAVGLAVSLVGGGCSGTVNDNPRAAAIDQLIDGIDPLPSPDPLLVEGDRSPDQRDGDFSCFDQNYQETRRYDRIVAYSANAESLWPGALVRGDALYDGLFTQIVADRAPMGVSVSLENLAGKKSAVMQQPSLSSFREALGGILDTEVHGATPANIYAEIEQVHSQKQLDLALGASASSLGALGNISASFEFDKQDVRSRYVVRYIQSYYTVDVDPPAEPSGLFGPDVTAGELSGKMGPDSPPLYVSSVTYGRMVLFTFESSYSAEELGAALEFAYRGGVDVSGDVSVTYEDILSRSKITAYILGGSGGEAARSIDSYQSLMDFIKSGGNYSADSPGAPIAYHLAYARDNAPARMSLTEDYTEHTCARVSQKVRVVLESIEVVDAGQGGSSLELYGDAWTAADPAAGDGSATAGEPMFGRDRDHAVTIAEGHTWPQTGSVAEKVVDVVPQAGHVVDVGAVLHDRDDGLFSSDHSIGDESLEAPFETGWHRTMTVHMTGAGSQVQLTFSLEPI